MPGLLGSLASPEKKYSRVRAEGLRSCTCSQVEDEEAAVLAAGEAALDALVSLCDPESVSYNRQQTPVDVAALPPALKPDSWNGV